LEYYRIGNKYMPASDQTVEQFLELLQGFIRLRLNLVEPEPIARFKQQLDRYRNSRVDIYEDRVVPLRVFIVLAQDLAPPTMGALSADLGVPLSTATRVVDWLVRGDFVERLADPNDRRVVRVRMTENGQRLYQAALDFHKQRIARLLDVFSPEEQGQLLHLLYKLMDSLLVEP
jgi:DNA-binding MarR family transcriptional regulator